MNRIIDICLLGRPAERWALTPPASSTLPLSMPTDKIPCYGIIACYSLLLIIINFGVLPAEIFSQIGQARCAF